MRVEFLFKPGCPSAQSGQALLESVLREAGLQVEVRRIPVASAAEAAELGFPGSPTFRIDGRDVDPDVTPSTPTGLA
jgi:hypothetical protein